MGFYRKISPLHDSFKLLIYFNLSSFQLTVIHEDIAAEICTHCSFGKDIYGSDHVSQRKSFKLRDVLSVLFFASATRWVRP
jgi:hypothetical protein